MPDAPIHYDPELKLFVLHLRSDMAQFFSLESSLVGHEERSALVELDLMVENTMKEYEKSAAKENLRRLRWRGFVLVTVLAIGFGSYFFIRRMANPYRWRLSALVTLVELVGGAYLLLDWIGLTGKADKYMLTKRVMLEKYIRDGYRLL